MLWATFCHIDMINITKVTETGKRRGTMMNPRSALTLSATIVSILATAQVRAQSVSDAAPQSNTAAPELEEVVVVGIRRSLEASQDIKRNSDFVVDAIT